MSDNNLKMISNMRPKLIGAVRRSAGKKRFFSNAAASSLAPLPEYQGLIKKLR